MARKIQFKRGLKANLPKLSPAELAFTTDEKKAYIGDGNENIRLLDQKDKTEITTQLADKASKEYVAQEIIKVNTGGTVDLSHKADVSLVEELAGINAFTTVPTFTNGKLTQIEEKDGDSVKKRTLLTYNDDGTVKTVTNILEDKTVISTLNYVNGVFSSVSNQVTEGGL